MLPLDPAPARQTPGPGGGPTPLAPGPPLLSVRARRRRTWSCSLSEFRVHAAACRRLPRQRRVRLWRKPPDQPVVRAGGCAPPGRGPLAEASLPLPLESGTQTAVLEGDLEGGSRIVAGKAGAGTSPARTPVPSSSRSWLRGRRSMGPCPFHASGCVGYKSWYTYLADRAVYNHGNSSYRLRPNYAFKYAAYSRDRGEGTGGSRSLVTFPIGMSCTWQIRADVRKHYRFG